MSGISREAESLTECHLGLRGILILLAGTALYFALLFYFPPSLRAVFFGGVAVAALFLVRPEPRFWLLPLPLIFMAGGSTIPAGEFNPAIATMAMMAFTLLFVLDRILWNRPLFEPSPYLFWIFVALFIQICTVFIAIHVHGQYAWNAVREGSGIFLFLPMAVIIPLLCNDSDRLLKLLRAVVIALLAAAAIGVAQYFSITDFSRVDIGLGYIYRGRVASLFGNGNIFAGYLELTIPMAIALFFRDRSALWRTVALAAAGLGVLSVLYTFSRGGLIGMFMGSGLTLMYIFRRRPWIPFAIGFLVVLILVQYRDTFERQFSFFSDPHQQITQPTILHRYVSYRGFIEQVKDSPLTGVGWGAEEHFWGRSRLYSFWEVRHVVSTGTIRLFGGLNSLFFNQTVKGGAIALSGLLTLFAAIYAAFFRALKGREALIAVAVTAGTFSFMVHQLVDCLLIFPTVNSIFWINAGMLLAAVAIGKNGERPAPRRDPSPGSFP